MSQTAYMFLCCLSGGNLGLWAPTSLGAYDWHLITMNAWQRYSSTQKLFWLCNTGSGWAATIYTAPPSIRIFYTSDLGNSWESGIIANTYTPSSIGRLDTSMDTEGNLHVLWGAKILGESFQRIWYRKYIKFDSEGNDLGDEAGWETPTEVLVSGPYSDERMNRCAIAVTDGDEDHPRKIWAGFVCNDGIYITTPPWTDFELQTNNDYTSLGMVGVTNEAHLFYQQRAGTFPIYHRKSPITGQAGTWTAVTNQVLGEDVYSTEGAGDDNQYWSMCRGDGDRVYLAGVVGSAGGWLKSGCWTGAGWSYDLTGVNPPRQCINPSPPPPAIDVPAGGLVANVSIGYRPWTSIFAISNHGGNDYSGIGLWPPYSHVLSEGYETIVLADWHRCNIVGSPSLPVWIGLGSSGSTANAGHYREIPEPPPPPPPEEDTAETVLEIEDCDWIYVLPVVNDQNNINLEIGSGMTPNTTPTTTDRLIRYNGPYLAVKLTFNAPDTFRKLLVYRISE